MFGIFKDSVALRSAKALTRSGIGNSEGAKTLSAPSTARMGRTWILQVVVTVLYAGLLASPLALLASDNVYYIGTDSDVHELKYVSSWSTTNVTSLISAPAAAGYFLTGLENVGDDVFYIGTDGDIHSLGWYGSPQYWHTSDLTSLTSATAPASGTPITSEISEGNVNIYYIATDGDIHQISCSGDPCSWSTTDITSASSAPQPSSSSGPITSHAYETGDNVYFIASDGDVHQCSYYSSSWHTANITSAASALAPDSLSWLGGQQVGGTDNVYYVASDGDLHNLVYNSGWSDTDLTSSASATAPSEATAISANTYNSLPGVYYLDSNGNLSELYSSGGSWYVVNITSSSSGPTPDSAVVSSHVYGSAENVYYISGGEVQECSYYSGSWHASNPTQSAGATGSEGGQGSMIGFEGN